jgi:hypothetical protein
VTFSPGVSFSDDTSFTATATRDSLHSLITSAALSDVTSSEHSAKSFLIFRKGGGVRPTDAEDNDNRTLWFDEATAKLKQRGVPGATTGHYHDWETQNDAYNDDNTYTMPVGTVVESTGRWQYSPTITAEYDRVTGVVAVAMPHQGAYGEVVKLGLAPVLVDGPIKPGELLVTSSVTGHAASGINVNSGNFTMGVAFGQALYSLGNTNALVTCFLFL